MKKTIFLVMALQWVIISPMYSMSNNELPAVKEITTGAFTTVIINADVTVELLNTNGQAVQLSGDDNFMQNITIKQSGSRLVIDAVKNRNYKNKGVIYIPASAIKQIQINSAAHIQSAKTLRIPRLEILINGLCKVAIANKGELKLTGSEFYGANYVTRDARFPFVIINEQENQ
jgi:Putative auto-transporter adhesin, head GIN domain